MSAEINEVQELVQRLTLELVKAHRQIKSMGKDLYKAHQKSRILEYAARRRCCVELFMGYDPANFPFALECQIPPSRRTVRVFGHTKEDVLDVAYYIASEKGAQAPTQIFWSKDDE